MHSSFRLYGEISTLVGASDCHFYVPTNPTVIISQNDINADNLYPIKTEKEGNAFRAWINDNYPFAQNVKLDRTGDPRNGYLQQAYFELGSEYQKYQKNL